MTIAARRRLSQLRRDQRGVAAIEFAMIAPIFFGLLVGIIDVGRYMWTLNTIQYAIDQGVRAGVVQQLSTRTSPTWSRALLPAWTPAPSRST